MSRSPGLTEWRERALAGAATALKERERDDRDDEIARLKSKVGEITMDNELLYAKIEALEGKRPLAHRRSRRSARHDLLGSRLWHGARRAGVEDVARQRLSLSQGDAAEHDRPPPWSGRRMSDAELAEHIRQHIAASRLHGEGYRKLWARLRFAGVRDHARRCDG